MSLRTKISDFFIDNHGPELLLAASTIVIVVLMIQEVLAVIKP
ncbi:hypothetical protein [Desulfosporosinus sp.]|nr:hypothetical protein [Desulfosporosinus sp.]